MGGIWTFSGDFLSRVGGSIFLWHLGTKQTGLSDNKQTRSHRPQLFTGCFPAPSSITAKCSWPYKWMFPWFVQPTDPEVTLVHTLVGKWKIHSSSGFFVFTQTVGELWSRLGSSKDAWKYQKSLGSVGALHIGAATAWIEVRFKKRKKKKLFFVHCRVYWSPAVYRTN